MLRLDLAKGLPTLCFTLHGYDLSLGKNNPVLGNTGLQGLQALIEDLQVVPLPNTSDPTCRYKDALLTQFIAGSRLPKGRIVESHLYNGLFYSGFDPVFQNWLGAADFVKSCLATGVIQFFDSVKAISAVADHSACLGNIP